MHVYQYKSYLACKKSQYLNLTTILLRLINSINLTTTLVSNKPQIRSLLRENSIKANVFPILKCHQMFIFVENF